MAPARRGAGNLPTELTSFVGRCGEIAEVRRVLAESRLVTLTGVSGGRQDPAGAARRGRAAAGVRRRGVAGPAGPATRPGADAADAGATRGVPGGRLVRRAG